VRGEELRCLFKEWAQHSNHGRPRLVLGPGMPRPRLSRRRTTISTPILTSGASKSGGAAASGRHAS
jgi:hypothetical protein